MEPGGLYLGFPDYFIRSLRGDLGRRRNLELGDLLLQHGHHAVHDSISWRRPCGRPRNLREDFADELHQTGEDADADSTWRIRQTRADPERLRVAAGAGRPGREGR